jgi:hypothetical protein
MKQPTLATIEARLGPAATWAGRCYEIASACIATGFVTGTAVYGHWRGPVNPKSYFGKLQRNAPLPPRLGSTTDGQTINPLGVPGRRPAIYSGRNRGEYDEAATD